MSDCPIPLCPTRYTPEVVNKPFKGWYDLYYYVLKAISRMAMLETERAILQYGEIM